MLKRISCRVINSVALTKNSSEPLHAGSFCKKQHDSDDFTTNISPAYTSNSVKYSKTHNSTWATHAYTNRLDTAEIAVGNIAIGQILDFYA